MNLVLLDSLDRLLDHPPESPPGDDVPDDTSHVQQVSVLLKTSIVSNRYRLLVGRHEERFHDTAGTMPMLACLWYQNRL